MKNNSLIFQPEPGANMERLRKSPAPEPRFWNPGARSQQMANTQHWLISSWDFSPYT